MALGVPDWTSEISSILGFWTIVGIIAFLILCGRRIYYVYHLRDARRDALRRIQSTQDEIRSLRGPNPDLDSAISRALHSSEQRLNTLSETEDSLWSRFSALFRADPCLRLLEEHDEDLKQRVQRMTDVRLIILGAYNARQTDAALPTAEIPSRQTLEAGATPQPAESARTFYSGHSTTTESIGTSSQISRFHPASVPQQLSRGMRKSWRPAAAEMTLEATVSELHRDGIDEEAIDTVKEIFSAGLTIDALMRKMTKDESRRYLNGEKGQAYRALLRDVDKRFQCRLCREGANAMSWKHPRDVVRHLRRDHFGLGDACPNCHYVVYTTGEMTNHRCKGQ